MTSERAFRFMPKVARGWTRRVRGSLFPSEETTYPIKVMATKKGQTKGGSNGTPKPSAPAKPAPKKTPMSSPTAAPKTTAGKKTTEPKAAKEVLKPVKVPAVKAAAAVPGAVARKVPAKKTLPKSKANQTEPKGQKTEKSRLAVAPEFTPEVIAVRAYFLAEKRRAQSLPPDPTHDWLQAESELLAEIERFNACVSSKKAPKKKL